MRLPKQPSEKEIVRKIERLAARTQSQSRLRGLVLGVGDDAALWRPRKGFETILTTDWFLEGTHFWRDWHPPEVIGWKSLMRAASDIAAMGGEPQCFLLSLALPSDLANGWLGQFLRGMIRAAKKLGSVLSGGDTTLANKVLINVTVIGEAPQRTALLRSGAKAGDSIFVTGRLGEAELGLRLAKRTRKTRNHGPGELLNKHQFPEARIELGQWLRKTVKASAAIDLSDGLSLDLHRLCESSSVGAEVRAEQLPIASSMFAKAFHASQRLQAALHGGDDYELLFCVPPERCGRIPSSKFGIPLTQIGKIVSSRKISLVKRDGEKTTLLPRGWDPFR